eukprot:jgi/Botrbrau1/19095/Bobra.0077s0009.1
MSTESTCKVCCRIVSCTLRRAARLAGRRKRRHVCYSPDPGLRGCHVSRYYRSIVQAVVEIEPLQLSRTKTPGHIAVIMDGNARWAEQNGKSVNAGHEAGVQALQTTIDCCCCWGISALTVFAFSVENWKRELGEVLFLMGLIERVMREELPRLRERGVAVRFVGDLERLPSSLRSCIQWTEAQTRQGGRLDLTVAVGYGGRQDIVSAAKRLAKQVQAGELRPEQITEDVFEEQLSTGALPGHLRNPDVLIRSSGEQRLSNFLLWQLAYTELLYTPVLWPDFGEAELRALLHEYAGRQRRFGCRDPRHPALDASECARGWPIR